MKALSAFCRCLVHALDVQLHSNTCVYERVGGVGGRFGAGVNSAPAL